MSYLIDSNILLRSVQTAHPLHADAKEAIKLLKRQGEQLFLVAQNIYEFWGCSNTPYC
jgi:predicted nucleic acid-binding protein